MAVNMTTNMAARAVGLSLTGLFTLPAISDLVVQLSWRSGKAKVAIYRDNDGESLYSLTKACSALIPKTILSLLSVLGFATALTLAILEQYLSQSRNEKSAIWLTTGQWALICLQALCITGLRSHVRRYYAGLRLSLSCVVSLATQLYLDLYSKTKISYARVSPTSVNILKLAQVVLALLLLLCGFCLPRRPEVYFKGTLVDRQFTGTALHRYTFGWINGLLSKARLDNRLEYENLPVMDHKTRTDNLLRKWKLSSKVSYLPLRIVNNHQKGFMIQVGLTILEALLSFVPQFVILRMLKIFESRLASSVPQPEILLWLIALTLGINMFSWVEQWNYWVSWSLLAVPVRAVLSALIFEKAMRRKNFKSTSKTELMEDMGARSTVNLIGVDAKRVSDFCAHYTFFVSSMLKLIIATVFLQRLLGWRPVLCGYIVLPITFAINFVVTKKMHHATRDIMRYRDARLAVVTEALQGIRQIKFAAQESQWYKKIGAIREQELFHQKIQNRLGVAAAFCWIFSPIAVSATALSVYAWISGELDAATAFTAIGVFKNLETALSVIPELVQRITEANVSRGRIEDYLNGPETSKITVNAEMIAFQKASIAWPADDGQEMGDRFILRDIELQFPNGELSVIGGKTGAGKSLLLTAIIGEVDLLAGEIHVPCMISVHERHDSQANPSNWIIPSSVAFVGQIPWVENATIRDNILFGLPYDESRYRKVLNACALLKDLDMLPDGEWTEIGANGINLSGGQRWRITFARALYSRAGILVLDDIFSAVDAHVGRYIFENALVGELSAGRTRILVTHHVSLCEHKARYIVQLKNGTVEHAGLKEQLKVAGSLNKILRSEEDIIADAADDSTVVESDISLSDGLGFPKAVNMENLKKFVEVERREQGRVKLNNYTAYMKSSGGWPFWLVAAFALTLAEVSTVGQSWWLKHWTSQDTAGSVATAFSYDFDYTLLQTPLHDVGINQTGLRAVVARSEHTLKYYLGIYVGLAVSVALLGTFRFFWLFKGSLSASRELFERLCNSVLRAPSRWLDTVPQGRILGRFTSDLGQIDSALSMDLAQTCGAALSMFGVVAAAVFVTPWMLLIAALVLGLSAWLSLYYITGAREIKRLESTAKSPIFEQFRSALVGITTIRAFANTPAYIEKMHAQIDKHTVCSWYICVTNRWIAMRMALLGNLFTIVVASMVIVLPVPVALAGFALNFASQYGTTVASLVRQYTNLELDMNAAERIMEYATLQTETDGGVDPPAAWPTEGRIDICDLVVAYAPDLPPVLKGLSFSVEPRERIGVVGRTGAGKSSLTLALFRILEASSGSILIDGVDVSRIKLLHLRSRLQIILQDPVLFTGTVRYNLDPHSQHSDLELRDALERVHLATAEEFIVTPPEGSATPILDEDHPDGIYTSSETSDSKNKNIFASLSSPITEGGLNLSQGQRQLLCLARAIVSRPKIMILDEATSAVDMATDSLIQRSIREEFSDSTLLVIAHRLSTIADFDKILVMEDGKAVEFGSPKDLLQIPDGVFHGMVDQSGDAKTLVEAIMGSRSMKRGKSVRAMRNVYGV